MSRLDSDDLETHLYTLKKPSDFTVEDREHAIQGIREEFDRLTVEAGKATILYSNLIEKIGENISLKLKIEELHEDHKQRTTKTVRAI